MKSRIKLAIIGIKGIPANYGGFETCVDETSIRLINYGVQITVYCRKKLAREKISSYKGITLKYINGFNTKNLYTISSTLISVLKELFSTNNVVHIYTVGNAIFIPILKIFGKKCVISVDALDWKRKKWGVLASWLIKTSEIIAVKFADSVISDSQVICNYYFDKYKKRIDYIAFGANIFSKNNELNELEYGIIKKKYFIFVGLFRPEKNIDFLINAFKKANTKDFKLVLIGDDPMNPEYVNYLYDLANEKIVFLGRKYGEEYETLSMNAYSYVTASEVEGTSPALLAAMGFGLAVLVSDIDENKETIGEAGFTFKSNDEKDLIYMFEYLIHNEVVVESSSIKGLQRVKKYYSWDKISEEFFNIYKRIL